MGDIKGGEYFAAGVGGAVTGRGADLLIIDDPHRARCTKSANMLMSGTRRCAKRLQPGGAIVIIMTRWAENDLTGKLLRQQGRDILADKWEVVGPALMPESDEPLWPEFWKKEDFAYDGKFALGR